MRGMLMWPPSSSRAATARVFDVEPSINWGYPVDEYGDRHNDATITAREFDRARLTHHDTAIIGLLELDPAIYSMADRVCFQNLVQASDFIMGEYGIHLPWVEELFTFVPTYRHGTRGWDGLSTKEAAEYYINIGAAPVMLALHILMLRCNFWRRQIAKHAGKDFAIQLPECTDFSFTELIGDPAHLVPQLPGGGWSSELFESREFLLSEWEALTEGKPERRAVQDILDAMETLTRVAAAAHPGLKGFIEAYDKWESEGTR